MGEGGAGNLSGNWGKDPTLIKVNYRAFISVKLEMQGLVRHFNLTVYLPVYGAMFRALE